MQPCYGCHRESYVQAQGLLQLLIDMSIDCESHVRPVCFNRLRLLCNSRLTFPVLLPLPHSQTSLQLCMQAQAVEAAAVRHRGGLPGGAVAWQRDNVPGHGLLSGYEQQARQRSGGPVDCCQFCGDQRCAQQSVGTKFPSGQAGSHVNSKHGNVMVALPILTR